MNPRILAYCVFASLRLCVDQPSSAEEPRPPNVVILFADDLGYGDLGCYGHPSIRTPNLDRMAAEGLRFTQFYVAEPVCTPSRAALLTGRLPVQTGMYGDRNVVLFPDSKGGLPDGETTIAGALKAKGYATACVGKWHLGRLPPYLPTRHGFDVFFGLPYSNDMSNAARGDPPVPLMDGEKVVEAPVDQTTLTRRYTERAIAFIRGNRDRPFFLYFPHTFPHVPLFASDAYRGRSPRGLYGDVVEELDASVGEVLKTLRDLGLAENTLVFFTSDNGPWLTKGVEGGSAGLLRDGKGNTWEGGTRVPAVAWGLSRIAAGTTTRALGCTTDLLPTCLELAGLPPPEGRPLEGTSLVPILEGKPGRRGILPYFRGSRLMAVRKGPWKAHFITDDLYDKVPPEEHNPPLLFHLDRDPSERFDVAMENPDVVADLRKEAERIRSEIKVAPSELDR